MITAQHRLGIVYPTPPSTFQGQDQIDLVKPLVKGGGPILSWDRIPDVVRMAFREMWTGRPGPVHLEIPAPVIHATDDEKNVTVLPAERYRSGQPQPSEEQLRQAAEMIMGARRPLVISGSGVDRGDANAELLEIVELINCPVISTMAGRSTVPFDHPNLIFGFGLGGDAVRRESDVVIVAGSRLGNLDLPFDKYSSSSTASDFLAAASAPRRRSSLSPPTRCGGRRKATPPGPWPRPRTFSASKPSQPKKKGVSGM